MFRKLLKRVVLLLALAYLGGGIFLYTQQSRFLYFPQFTRVAAEQTDFSLRRDGIVLRGWSVNPGHERALIYFGGNGESIQRQREKLARWAPDRSGYLLAYRGYGASDGVPGEAALFGDALALYDELRSHHPGIAVIGRSLGTGVASYLASQRPVERLVLVTPFDSIARVAQARYPIYPASWLLRDKFESWRYAPQVHCPVLVVQALDDEVIPARSTAALVSAFTPPPQWLRIANAGHNTLSDDPAYAAGLSEFLR